MDVREAARRTLAAGSARVWTRNFLDPPVSHPLVATFLMTAEGVADLTRRRVRLEIAESPEMEAALQRIASKWPWLAVEDDDESTDEVQLATVVIAGRRYVGSGQHWTLGEHGSQLDNPAWILDALAGAGGARRVGREHVRGTACERLALEPVDLRAAVRASNGSLELPSHGHLENPTLRGDIWVDGDGLVRRVVWSQPPRGRPRLRRGEAPHSLWHSAELWDFGLPVSIEVPDPPEPLTDAPPFVRILLEAGTALWGMRRDYMRRQRRAD